MTKAKSLLATGILALFSATAFASPLPSEIYRPDGAHTIKKPIIKVTANLNTKPNSPANAIPFLPWPKK